jgi:IclR family acetate operon transcriptional repressor
MSDLPRPAAGTGRGGVQSIDRAVAILRCFDARHPELGTTEIAAATGLSTSTTHRLLTAMASHHLVRQTPSRRYGLGPLLMQLVRSGALPTTLRDVALPFMASLRDEVDETVGLHELLPSGERVVVDQVESRHELRRTYTDFGVPIPPTYGAPGKAILSVLPASVQQAWLRRRIPAVTERTITDPERLRAELAEARARGWAHSRSERTPGIRAVAAPVFGHSGAVTGALGISVPEVRMSDARTEILGARASAVAWEVSEALGVTREAIEETVRAAGGR